MAASPAPGSAPARPAPAARPRRTPPADYGAQGGPPASARTSRRRGLLRGWTWRCAPRAAVETDRHRTRRTRQTGGGGGPGSGRTPRQKRKGGGDGKRGEGRVSLGCRPIFQKKKQKTTCN